MKKLFKNLVQAGVCTTLICGANAAIAGQLTGFYAVKKTVKVGEFVSLVASGTAQCGVVINDGNGKIWQIGLTDTMNPATKSFGASYNKPGKFHLTAAGKGGAGKLDCNAAPVLAEDVTVLGAPPPCTFDTAVQKEYLEVGIKVKTCEVSSTPPTQVGTRADAPPVVVSDNHVPGLAPAKITGVVVTPQSVYLGGSFLVTANGTGAGTSLANCVSGFYLDKLVDPKVYGYAISYNHFKLPTYDQNTAFPRKTTFTPTEVGTYQVRIIPGGNYATCGLENSTKIPG